MASRLHRIRLEAEGSSAADVERELALTLARIGSATGLDLIVDTQVIELNEGKRPTAAVVVDSEMRPINYDGLKPWNDGWYFGRLTAFPHNNDSR